MRKIKLNNLILFFIRYLIAPWVPLNLEIVIFARNWYVVRNIRWIPLGV